MFATVMPSPKKDPDAQKATGKTTVKLPVDLHRRARMVASDRGIDLSDYLEALLRPAIDKDYKQMVRRMAGEED